MKIILITGAGLGKTFTAYSICEHQKTLGFSSVIMDAGSAKEASVSLEKAASMDFLVMTSNRVAESLKVAPWQTIVVSGGYPLVKPGEHLETPTSTFGESAITL